MNPINFESFIFASGRFRRGAQLVPVGGIASRLRSGPLEGFVQVRVNGREMIHKDLWDTLDLLWPMYVRIARDLAQGESAEEHLPDKNRVTVTAKRLGAGRLVSFAVKAPASSSEYDAEVTVRRRELIDAILRDGLAFYEKMLAWAHPNDLPAFQADVARLREVQDILARTSS